jgi:hypothetical protein
MLVRGLALLLLRGVVACGLPDSESLFEAACCVSGSELICVAVCGVPDSELLFGAA